MSDILCPSFARTRPLWSLSDDEMLQFIYELNRSIVTYKETIPIFTHNTFGTELEFENVAFGKVETAVKNFNEKWNHPIDAGYQGWTADLDTSVVQEKNQIFYGGEVDSLIMKNTKKDWEELKDMCELLKNMGASITEKTSTHVHVGSQVIGSDIENWITFLKLWTIYEDVIFKFSMGDKLYLRTHAAIYAQPCRKIYQYQITQHEKLWRKNSEFLFDDICDTGGFKRSSLEIIDSKPSEFERKNTIEFRCPNGTLEPTIIQNNIQFFVHLLEYVGGNHCDRNWVNRKFKESLSLKTPELKRTLQNRSVELADLIYDDLDSKCCFLIQCWKHFEKPDSKHREKVISFYQKM